MPSDDITVLLRAWGEGDVEAQERVWPELYSELKIVARSVLRHRRGGPGTTSLVHEAALRLLGVEIDWGDRHHFYAAAARAMRFIVVDEVRRRLAQKRGGEQGVDELPDEILDPNTSRLDEVLSVHQSLGRLAKTKPRLERLVELRYFAGLSVQETADVLGISVPTAVRDWRTARTWLHGALQASS